MREWPLGMTFFVTSQSCQNSNFSSRCLIKGMSFNLGNKNIDKLN